jgi:hypothetical protein
VVVAHALRCENWAHRRHQSKPPVRMNGESPSADAATA